MKNTVKRSLAAALALTMALGASSSLMACGEFELTSIVVSKSSVDTEYVVGEEVSFDGIVIKAKFNDGTEEEVALSACQVFLGDEDVSANLSKITESIGKKSVVIKYEGKSATLEITVVKEGGETMTVVSYEAPEAYTSYKNATTQAGKTAYAAEKGEQKNKYETEFFTGDEAAEDYLVGDDNPFKFLPRLSYLDSENNPGVATKFRSDSVLSVWAADEFDQLDSRVGAEEDTVEYYDGETVYATAYVAKNEYTFTEAALNKKFSLSVLPASNYIYEDQRAVSCVFTVIDGYNVYEAKQLAVIDNGQENGRDRKNKDGVYFWADIKEAEGLTDVNPKAVIFQNDISVTKDDIPETMKYTLDEEIFYYRNADVESKENPIPAPSNTFVYDQFKDENDSLQYLNILTRFLKEGETFDIYGNYHALDLSNMPLACVFDNEYDDDGCGGASHVAFLRVEGVDEEGEISDVETGTYSVNDLNVIGNANIEDLMYSDVRPVYAGGAIFVKSAATNLVVDNVVARTSFIPFYPEDVTTAVIKNSKAYDSFNSAVYSFEKATFTVENCNFERAGGPLFLLAQQDPDSDAAGVDIPYVTVDDASIFQNFVTGSEFWFSSKGANSQIQTIVALNGVFNPIQKSITSGEGENAKFNMIALVLPNGESADALTGATQGYFSYQGTALDRINNDPVNHEMGMMANVMLGLGSPNFNAGTSFGCMLPGNTAGFAESLTELSSGLATDPVSLSAVPGAGFFTSKYVAVNAGPLGLFLELFTLPTTPQA